jgi:alkylated DNA repair protein alkB family protein 1
MTSTGDGTISAFKQAQTRHRRKGAAPNRVDDLDDMLDFSSSNNSDLTYSVKLPPSKEKMYEGPLFGIHGFPGFLYAPQALSVSLQTELAFGAVSEYCEAPHATNIDLVPPKTDKEENNVNQSMWELWKEQNASTEGANGKTLKKYRCFAKLSWATMGYQYDWTARAYHEGAKSPVPILLKELATLFARSLTTDFKPEACIVNFYHLKSIMGGHRDDLELALDKPVISISLGLPAVFLLGGKAKNDMPVIPILVRPGDVMILGGESRLNFHGMARVFPVEVILPSLSKNLVYPQSFQLTSKMVLSSTNSEKDGEELSTDGVTLPESDQIALRAFLSNNRININVRQVLPDGMNKLPDMPDNTHAF